MQNMLLHKIWQLFHTIADAVLHIIIIRVEMIPSGFALCQQELAQNGPSLEGKEIPGSISERFFSCVL